MIGNQQSFGVVRDKVTGKPKVDNKDHLHPIQLGLMSRAERQELGVWDKDWVLDMGRMKPVELLPDGSILAEEELVSPSEIYSLGDNPGQTRRGSLRSRVSVRKGHSFKQIVDWE